MIDGKTSLVPTCGKTALRDEGHSLKSIIKGQITICQTTQEQRHQFL